MTEGQIREIVFGALKQIAPEIDPTDLDPSSDLREQVDLDSMDFFNLAIGIGEQLGIEIPDADAARLTTLDGAISYLASRNAEIGEG